MIKILLDSNFLVYCAKQKIDYAEQIDNLISERHELAVLSSVLCELKELAEKAEKLKDKSAAVLALKILDKARGKKIRIIETEKQADEAIVEFAENSEDEVMVATADKGLKRMLKNRARILTIKRRNIEIL